VARVLVIGYGNPLRGDDALGWEIARRLASANRAETFEALALHQLTPELSAYISEVEMVVFIDASRVGQPGTWKCETLKLNATSWPTFGHHLTPIGLLAYAHAIFSASPPALLISVAGGSFDCRQGLTPSVTAALPAVEKFVREQSAVTRASRPLRHSVFAIHTASRKLEFRKERRIVDRSEIADIFCVAVSSGKVPALLENFICKEATLAVLSATGQSSSERRYLGILGLRQLAEFCRGRLKIEASEMTGCVIKGDCLFAFGKVHIGGAAERSPAETSFVVNLVWRGLQIVSAQFRIMWPFPLKDGDRSSF